jgi:voltage-gated potassium channel
LTSGQPAIHREWWFTQLTLFIWAWMLIGPALEDRWLTHLLLQVCLLNAVLTTLKANPEWVLARGVTIGLWLLALAGSLIAFAPVPRAWERFALGIETVSILPLLALLAAGILRFVYRSRRLTIDGVFATIIVYMIVAIFFSRLYLLLLGVDPQALDLPVPMASRTSQLLQVDLLYYSLITQCSVGYGDILPVSDAARMLAAIQAVVGQFYMAVVVAIFVGMYATQRRD